MMRQQCFRKESCYCFSQIHPVYDGETDTVLHSPARGADESNTKQLNLNHSQRGVSNEKVLYVANVQPDFVCRMQFIKISARPITHVSSLLRLAAGLRTRECGKVWKYCNQNVN